jgi:HK97 family phage prohead protease
MPFANEHASRLIDPKELSSRAGFESVRRTHGSGKGKVQGISIPNTIDIIWYVYKNADVIAQTLRFPIEHWTSAEALKWLKDNKIKYLSFEKATNGKGADESLTKNFECAVKDIDEKGIVSIYVNAYGNLDSDRDISEPGCFTKTCRENLKRIKHLKDHDRQQLLGLPVEFNTTDPYGLLVRSAMNIDKQMVKDVYSDYKFFAEHGRTLEHSIGYSVVKFSIENPEDWSKRIRKIQEYKLFEYSTLSFLGANERTRLVDIKATASSLKDELGLLNDMLIKGDYSDEKYKLIEEKILEIQNKIKEAKTLNEEEPSDKDTKIVEPDTLFKETKIEINYSEIIKQIKLK